MKMRYPEMNVSAYATPYYREMTDEQCRLLHEASLEVLERTGVRLYYQPAIDLLKKAGCFVDGNHVRIPPRLVEWALRTAPSWIMIYDRFGNPAMPLGGRICTYGTGSDCLNILDHRTGERRKAKLQDVVDGIRVADAMPNVDFIMSMFLPSDVPVAADVRQMEIMLTYSAKPICFVTYEWEGTPEVIEMLETAVGGADSLRAAPTAILYLNPTDAFRHDEGSLRKLMYAAERHLPTIYMPDVQRGMSAPMTLAGAMVCSNVGQLVGLVIAQLVSEGTPIILSTARPSYVDMRTMVMPYGTGTGGISGIELNHYYDLPAFSTGGATDSKLLDEQAIFEATMTLYGATLRGGNMIHDMGYMESGLTGSLELLVIEDEIVSWIKACMKGLEINEETLALDVIHEHALSGDFMRAKHTVRHVREGWQPRLIDRQNYEQWKASGGTSMRERARAKIEEILAEEPRHVLPRDVEERIKAIAERAVSAQSR
ncbi:trimethylamine methyltransferase [Candidatus Bathyarchaeota archaeon]|nr:MAG: trimethylamine methyltransferase [Candidatus Bathyarchaeota archaeon]